MLTFKSQGVTDWLTRPSKRNAVATGNSENATKHETTGLSSIFKISFKSNIYGSVDSLIGGFKFLDHKRTIGRLLAGL